VNAIETANLNAETMIAMKKGAEALKGIHGNMYVVFPTFRFGGEALHLQRFAHLSFLS
jgi:hypothetical protein